MSVSSAPLLLDEPGLVAVAQSLSGCLPAAACVHLIGDLGAGKTTFVRALLQSWAPAMRVKSPTYALVERYRIGAREVVHADLYRLDDPAEVEPLGLREAVGSALLLIEWPERGAPHVPPPDLRVLLEVVALKRRLRFAVPGAVPPWLARLWPAAREDC